MKRTIILAILANAFGFCHSLSAQQDCFSVVANSKYEIQLKSDYFRMNQQNLSYVNYSECLQDYRGCGYIGATQATYTVGHDGSWRFSVRYYDSPSCYREGTGAVVQSGAVAHEEYSLNRENQCLELVNRQYFQ